jgi:hypothetical protein
MLIKELAMSEALDRYRIRSAEHRGQNVLDDDMLSEVLGTLDAVRRSALRRQTGIRHAFATPLKAAPSSGSGTSAAAAAEASFVHWVLVNLAMLSEYIDLYAQRGLIHPEARGQLLSMVMTVSQQVQEREARLTR